MKYAEAAWWVMVSSPGYLAIGLIWARCSAVRIQERLNSYSENPLEAHLFLHDDPLEVHLILHTILWPFMILGNALLRVMVWTAEPVEIRREEVADLRAKVKRMEELAETLPGDAESAEALAKTYREMADKLDL